MVAGLYYWEICIYIYTIGISGTYGWDMGYLEWISIMAMIRYGYGNNMYIYRYIYIYIHVYIYICVLIIMRYLQCY